MCRVCRHHTAPVFKHSDRVYPDTMPRRGQASLWQQLHRDCQALVSAELTRDCCGRTEPSSRALLLSNISSARPYGPRHGERAPSGRLSEEAQNCAVSCVCERRTQCQTALVLRGVIAVTGRLILALCKVVFETCHHFVVCPSVQTAEGVNILGLI